MITLPDLDIEVTGVWRYFPENALAHSLAAGIGSEPHSLDRLKIQCVREQLVLCKLEPRRTSARNREEGLKGLQHLTWIVGKSKRIADEVKRSLDGLVAPVWIEEYVATRLSPLQDELAALTAQAEASDASSNIKKGTP